MVELRSKLKTYFETGDFPTEEEFSRLIDSFVHLNELDLGLEVKPSVKNYSKFYHFYLADNLETSGKGHLTIEAEDGSNPEDIDNYTHILSRRVNFKRLDCRVNNNLTSDIYKPKVIIERYQQAKKRRNRGTRPRGYYQEDIHDAQSWGRQSEYEVNSSSFQLDLFPINYFRPNQPSLIGPVVPPGGFNDNEIYKNFLPSGAISKTGSFKFTRHSKPFVPIQLVLVININGKEYRSKPHKLKIVLGSSGQTDAINFFQHD